MTKRAVILAGGKGTRLAPYTTVFPKPLMPLGDTPILEVILRQLARGGFEHATLAVGHLAELMEAFCGDGEKFGVAIDYVREDAPLGTAGSLAMVSDLSEDAFLVMNGDVLSTLDYAAFLDRHAESGACVSIATYVRRQQVDFGVVVSDPGGRVTDYVEKPENEYLVSMGVYGFSPRAIAHIDPGERLDFPDLVTRLLAAGEYVRSEPFDGYWLDIGRHDDFAAAQDVYASSPERFLPRD